MTSEHFKKIQQHVLADESESAAFLIAGYFKNAFGIHFTVRDIIIPDEKDYNVRSAYRLEVSPIFFNKTISIAEANNVTVIQCHSHPFSKMNFGILHQIIMVNHYLHKQFIIVLVLLWEVFFLDQMEL